MLRVVIVLRIHCKISQASFSVYNMVFLQHADEERFLLERNCFLLFDIWRFFLTIKQEHRRTLSSLFLPFTFLYQFFLSNLRHQTLDVVGLCLFCFGFNCKLLKFFGFYFTRSNLVPFIVFF